MVYARCSLELAESINLEIWHGISLVQCASFDLKFNTNCVRDSRTNLMPTNTNVPDNVLTEEFGFSDLWNGGVYVFSNGKDKPPCYLSTDLAIKYRWRLLNSSEME